VFIAAQIFRWETTALQSRALIEKRHFLPFTRQRLLQGNHCKIAVLRYHESKAILFFRRGIIMESTSFGLHAAGYGVNFPVAIGAAPGPHQTEEVARNPAIGNASQVPASTRVTISAAGQSRLAVEQQAAIAPQNVPVQAGAESADVRNSPNTTTADATVASIAVAQNASAPQQPASVTSPTGAATPSANRENTGALASVAANPASGVAPETSPAASALDNQSVPVRQAAEQGAQLQSERQDTQAQARQDNSPALAQSGLTDNREVLSP
jgi:hypothetical protein